MWSGITDPAHLEEVGLLLYNEGKEEYVWNHMSSLGASCDSKRLRTATMV